MGAEERVSLVNFNS